MTIPKRAACTSHTVPLADPPLKIEQLVTCLQLGFPVETLLSGLAPSQLPDPCTLQEWAAEAERRARRPNKPQ